MIIITTKQNKQHGSKSTNYNLQMWPFEPAGKKPMFPERSVRVSTEGENENIRHIFDLRVHVFAKCGNGRKEIAGRWQNNSLCQSYVSRALLKCKVSYRKILSGETLCFLEKRLLSLFKFCAFSKLLFSYELLIGPLPIFLECIVIYLWSDRSTLSTVAPVTVLALYICCWCLCYQKNSAQTIDQIGYVVNAYY